MTKMFYITVILCSVTYALAAPATEVVPLEKQQPTVIPIVSQSDELEPNGTYKFSYETGNGIKREETSYDKVNPNPKGRSADSNEGGESDESNEIHVQIGSYSYTAPDGTVISVRYIADENGFQPIGDHIPRIGGPTVVDGSARGSKALKSEESAQPKPKKANASSKPDSAEISSRLGGEAGKSSETPTEGSTTEAKAASEASPNSSTTEGSSQSTTEGSTESSSSAASEATTVLSSATSTTVESSTTEAASSTTESASSTTNNATEASSEGSTTEAGSTTDSEQSTTEVSTKAAA